MVAMMRSIQAAAGALCLLLAGATGALADSAAFEALIKAAQQEGAVVLDGPPLDKVREALTQGFTKRYGIPLTYIGSGGPRSAARVRAERAADKYLVDVLLSGPDTIIFTALPSGWVDPIEPALLDPQVTDASKWKDGHLWYGDPKHMILRVLGFITPTIAINTKLVKPDEMRSYQNLLDKKWQGKIIAKDPTITGSGASMISYLYLQFGPDFVRTLYKDQKPFVSRDPRQAAQALAQGNYPVAIGPDIHAILSFKALGYPIDFAFPSDGPRVLSGGFGFLSLVNKAPHPNAAKLLINWLASAEGESLYAKAGEFVSLRTDIKQDWAEDFQMPRSGETTLDTMSYEFVTEQRDSAFEKVRKLLDF
jgi:iron(III) transport system substrate-binding protein